MGDAGPDGRSDERVFEAVVIGSGFGGSVMAFRLQQALVQAGAVKDERGLANRRVLLLERGMPYPPGSFARTPRELGRGFWQPNGSRYGLFELWRFQHSTVLVSSGLGGGSLIYANVLIEKPPATFDDAWPLSYHDLRDHYAEVRKVLEPIPLPNEYHDNDHGLPPAVPKTAQFKAAADGVFGDVRLADLAITFKAPGAAGDAEGGVPFVDGNLHGKPRRTCTLVGECDIGCNEGAKNTLDFNYLTKFKNDAGGEIRCCCEAVRIRRAGDGYEVEYVQHRPPRERVQARDRSSHLLDPAPERDTNSVRARVVVLAAGVLGSTRLLLSSRAGLGELSGQLGRRFSSNGDMLLFARGCTTPDGDQRDLAPSRGPVITTVASGGGRPLGPDIPGDLTGVWFEDAGGPGLSEWGWQLPELGEDIGRLVWQRRRAIVRCLLTGRRRSAISADVSRTLGTARDSSAMLPLLAMGRDRAGGRITLDGDELQLDWDPGDSAEHFQSAEAAGARVSQALGGALSPRARWLRQRMRGLTVHPLGGCAMAHDVRDGVVDPHGEVFGHEGLFVCDGSVAPGPIGPNPSLTIAALASHFASRAIKRMGIERTGP